MKTYFVIVVMMVLLVGCKDPEVEKKIDPALKIVLVKLKNTGQLDKRITILFKTTEDLTDLHYLMLKKRKVKVIANIGNIYTATIPAKSVYNFAKLKFVRYVQGKKRLKAHPSEKL